MATGVKSNPRPLLSFTPQHPPLLPFVRDIVDITVRNHVESD